MSFLNLAINQFLTIRKQEIRLEGMREELDKTVQHLTEKEFKLYVEATKEP